MKHVFCVCAFLSGLYRKISFIYKTRNEDLFIFFCRCNAYMVSFELQESFYTSIQNASESFPGTYYSDDCHVPPIHCY